MKLHLGCGNKFIKGFVHVDLLDYDHIDYRVPIDDLNFADDCSVDLIYAAHVLEHTGRYEFENVLKEWYRVLIPRGVLRIAVPDFAACVKYYQLNNQLQDILDLLIGRRKDEFDYHKMIFDESTLNQALTKIGFNNIQRYDWMQTDHSDIDDYSQAYLPHMDKKTGSLMSLNIEAVK